MTQAFSRRSYLARRRRVARAHLGVELGSSWPQSANASARPSCFRTAADCCTVADSDSMAPHEDPTKAAHQLSGMAAAEKSLSSTGRGSKRLGTFDAAIRASPTARVISSAYGTMLGSADAVLSEDLERFQATFTLSIAVCVLGIVLATVALLADRAFWGNFVLIIPYYSLIIFGRVCAASFADQRHAVVFFGRIWLLATLTTSVSFALLNKYYHFCEDLSLISTCCCALLTAFIPSYLKLMGVQPGIRFLTCATWLTASALSPKWTQMPHAHAQLFMTLAVIAGEAAGNGLVMLFRGPIAGVEKHPLPDDHVAKSALASPPALPDDSGPTGKACPANSSHTSRSAGRSSDDILNLDISAIRIVPVTLQFAPANIQEHYRAYKFEGSADRHAAFCAVGVVLGIVAAIMCPEEQLLGGVTVGFYLTLLTANSIIREQKLAAERAVLLLGRAWVGAAAVWLTLFAMLQLQLYTAFEVRHTGTIICYSILSAMMPAHLRLLALLIEHELAVKGLVVSIFASNYLLGLYNYLASALSSLNPDGASLPLSCVDGSLHAYYTLLTVLLTLSVGEIVSYSIKSVEMMAHVRFLKASKLTAVAEQRAKAAEEAMLAEMATVQRLEAQNAIDARNRLADSRLNHVIKGHCGTAVSSLITFIQMLPPYLLSPLPPHVQRFISAPIEQLGIVIHWSQRRQMLIQQEEGTYVSVRTPTNVEEVLESTLGNGGVVDADPAVRALSVDEGVLRLVVDEALMNARKYGRDGTIVMSASFNDDSLHVTVSNANKEGLPCRSAEEWAQLLQQQLRAPGAATKDVLGLPSIAKAVEQAHGSIVLSSELGNEQERTLLRLTLPASTTSFDDAGALDPDKAGLRSAVRALSEVPSFGRPREAPYEAAPCAAMRGEQTGGGERVCAGDELGVSEVGGVCCAPSRGVGEANACGGSSLSRQSLFCLSIDDAWQPRMLHTVLFEHYLHADMRLSGSLDGSAGQLPSFFFVALGVLDKTLQAMPANVPVRQADVVLLPERVCQTDGVSIARELRGGGFCGTICLLADQGAPLSHGAAEIDLVFDPSSSPGGMATRIIDLISRKALAPPAPSLHKSSSSTPSCRSASKLVCASIDDEDVPRMMLEVLIETYLGADMRYSCAVGASIEQQRAFADIALGLVDAELRPLAERRVVDVVVLDENINLSVSPPILGSNLIKDMRARGFTGVACIMTGESSERLAQLQKQPSIDIVVEKGTPLQQIAELILHFSLATRG
uniref:Response regulatory domain-containing protein n=1 Tax=Chrysotila carterae TaxID=13221 RepID=A0A7S4BYQ6_CHRCT